MKRLTLRSPAMFLRSAPSAKPPTSFSSRVRSNCMAPDGPKWVSSAIAITPVHLELQLLTSLLN